MVSIFWRIRGTLISPEMVVILIAAYLLMNTPKIVLRTATVIAAGPEAVKYIALLPAGVLVWCLSEAKSILLPSEDTKAILLNWPRYINLKFRVTSGLIFQLLFALASFSAWAYSPTFSAPKSLIIAVMSVIGSLICSATFFFASISIREILKRANS